MLSMASQLSLEPVFCKSTGAFRPQVSRFCHFEPAVEGGFELARAVKPHLIDSDCWSRVLPQASQIAIHPKVLVKHGVRSILNRNETCVTMIIHPQNGFVVEFNDIFYKGEEFSTENLISALKRKYGDNFDSIAITLIRHGLFTIDEDARIRSARATGVFHRENWVEILRLETQTFLRSMLSGRTVDMTEHLFVVELIESMDAYRVKDQGAFQHLCRLGILRQVVDSSI